MLTQLIERLIELDYRIEDYYEVESRKYHPNYPLVGPDDPETPPPPEKAELEELVAAQSDDTVLQLLLIGKLGRYEFGVGDLATQYADRLADGEKFLEPRLALLHMSGLGDCLTKGLEILRRNKINPEKLPLRRPRVKKS